ncbi:hypothetical protein MCOR27_006846 [Pyricularia oryzae]|uniref:Uncharacterized protein n=2 Tax=Pyricularia TaxID=48558 RepID=A0ABQ8NT77_PYRGI|nr:hypothetical protein MCOR01_009425 [Pyricularia oryzae]KAI6301536.1 hypothetical protein MCOR33_002929 [Pyricularia grisea]KAH9437310.1 hypothetical protein MCOR02_000965 [Pyricularia oryzae]KAI6275723.1 hypothetical protein MCOR27_006846 [Pyricularia oryzae]KAI6279307.1 hypothetical protein MCOR26_004264 [Pyricularia oryzae]
MTRFISFLAVSALALLATAQDAPTKPAVDKSYNRNNINQGLGKHLEGTRQEPNVTEWENKAVWPEGCRVEAEAAELKAEDFRVYEVRYGDCDEPWHMCVHDEAGSSKEHLAEQFGRIPIGMRAYVRNLVAQPQHFEKKTITAHFRSTGDMTTFVKVELATLVHEIGHALDFLALKDKMTRDGKKVSSFSKTKLWQDAVGKDSNVPTEYSRKSWVENFAETVIMATFDQNVPDARSKDVGPWPDSQKWDLFEEQLRTVVDNVGGEITPDNEAKCKNRLQNSKVVPKNARTPKRELGLKPDVRIRDASINVIEGDSAKDAVVVDGCDHNH